MDPHPPGSDRVGHGEADLGHAQADNPPDDPEYIEDDAASLDADVAYHGDAPPPEIRGNDDPAPNAP